MDDECPICLEVGEKDEEWTITHCKHRFHKKCLDKLPAEAKNCPLCRAKLDIKEEEEKEEETLGVFHYVPLYDYDNYSSGLQPEAFPPIANYSFGLHPEVSQPTGSVNFSRMDRATLRFNAIHVSHGMYGLSFAL